MKASSRGDRDFWRKWSGSRATGPLARDVNRSALTLKLMQDHQYGSIVAAPTFGFPSRPGGERNWDYRYMWLRDASFTLYAMMRLGYVEEAQQFQEWLSSLLDYDSEQGPAAGLVRHRRPPRDIRRRRSIICAATWTHGRYVSATPPISQLQLDIYGEMMDATYLANKYGEAISHDGWLPRNACWNGCRRTGTGPTMVSGRYAGAVRTFCIRELMCWVAFDRGSGCGKALTCGSARLDVCGPGCHRQDIYDNFWSEERNSFVQREGSTTWMLPYC